MAGTYAANGIAIAAANAALDELATPGLFTLDKLSDELRLGLDKVLKGCRPAGLRRGPGPADLWFAEEPIPQLPRRRAPRRPEGHLRSLVARHAGARGAVPPGRVRKPVRVHRAHARGHPADAGGRGTLATELARGI